MSAQPYSRADRKRRKRKVGRIPFDLPRVHDGRTIARWTLQIGSDEPVEIQPPIARGEPVRIVAGASGALAALGQLLERAARHGDGWRDWNGNGDWSRDGKQTREERLAFRCEWKRQHRAWGTYSSAHTMTPTADLERRRSAYAAASTTTWAMRLA